MVLNYLICGCRQKLLNIATIGKVEFPFRTNARIRNLNVLNQLQQSRNNSLPTHHRIKQQEAYWLMKDKLPRHYELIYRAPLDKYIIVAAFSTGVFALITASAALFTHFFAESGLYHEITIAGQVYSSNMDEFKHLMILTAIITLTIYVMTRRYVLRIYKGPSDYVSAYTSNIPMFYRYKRFKAGSVEFVPMRWDILPWANTLYKINGKKAILLENEFKSYHELSVMMHGEKKNVLDPEK